MHILIIEDEADLAASAAAQLESLGHEVAVARDLAEARACMEDPDSKIRLVIADHRLPDGRGIDFVLRMRSLYEACDYVIVSACLTPGDIENLENMGLPYFHKPLLYKKVIDSMRRARAMRAPTVVPEAQPEAGSVSMESRHRSVASAGGGKSRFGFLRFGKSAK